MGDMGDRTYALMVDRLAESEGKVDQLAGLCADLTIANKALRAALRKYGDHHIRCASTDDFKCDCGFDAVMILAGRKE